MILPHAQQLASPTASDGLASVTQASSASGEQDSFAARSRHLPSSTPAAHIRAALSAPGVPVSLPFALPSVGSLVYSATGFDILSILARVATRAHPRISLGPVDMTCSFAVVDVRRFDHPIVYASPTFYKLTGYSEDEVIGNNCRFLQAPGGQVQKGEQRRHTAQDAVAHMRKSLVADKECQVSLVNYRKDGSAFINLVTIIPITGGVSNAVNEAEDIVYHVGFQVDLTEQPNAILQKVQDGSYMVHYSNNVTYPTAPASKDWKTTSVTMTGVSRQLRTALSNQDFVNSIPISASTTTLSLSSEEKSDPYDGNRLLSLVLLETSPDFVLVLSLKGTFLYVSPSVRRVLGYDPEELVGKSITDFCHEADKIPLIRELKESSSTVTASASLSKEDKESEQSPPTDSHSPATGPRSVDLLFRMQSKTGAFSWIECSGKLFVEPGKGRKAIILSGRVRDIPRLQWGSLGRAGGLTPPSRLLPSGSLGGAVDGVAMERECWALLSVGGSFLYASTAIRDVLGWGTVEVIGRLITSLLGGRDPSQAQAIVQETLHRAFTDRSMESRSLSCTLVKKDGSEVLTELIFYTPSTGDEGPTPYPSATRPLVCQIRLADASPLPAPSPIVHPHGDDAFSELDTTRGSGWQYELQQLKYANQRLIEEVKMLEAKVEERRAREPSQFTHRRAVSSIQQPLSENAWATHIMSHPVSATLKRSWDGNIVATDHGGMS